MTMAKILLSRLKNLMSNREAKNASWIILGRVAQMLISFIVGILTARYLGPSNYGILNYGAAYVLFFTPLCTLGINSIIIKAFLDYPNDIGEIIGTTLLLKLISSMMSVVVIFFITSFVDKGDYITIGVVVLCSMSLIFEIFDTFLYWFQLDYKSKVGAIAGMVAYSLVAIYRVFLLVSQKGIYWFAFGTSLDYILVAMIVYLVYINNKGPKLHVSKIKAKYLLKNSYHYILSGMMIAVYSQTDKFMLKIMTDDSTLGMYSLATTLNYVWVFVLQAIIDSMYPTILRLHKVSIEEFERKNKQLYAVIIYISVVVACILILFGNLIITKLYGKDYQSAVAPLRIVVWYTIFSYLGVARDAWIVCEKRQKYLKYIYSSAAIINVLLNMCFIPLWGASGAAIASLATQVLSGVLLPFCIKDLRRNVMLMLKAICFWKTT